MTEGTNCPSCGIPLDHADRFCSSCGAALPHTPPAPSGDADAVELFEVDEALTARVRDALSPRFLLVRPLGAGGMGTVFLAREPALKRLVAVKVLSPELASDASAKARFHREAQAVAGLSHPNVVAIYSVGELDDGTPYFVMQYVGGRSMAARLEDEGPFQVDETRRVLGEVASALAAAHKQGIIHRDIKPANVLYDEESGRALVTDFGIAALIGPPGAKTATRLTQTGMAIGTPQYMSPEQIVAEKVTERTDMYGLGLLGYELLAGEGPFGSSSSPQELVAAHLRDVPENISTVRDDIDPEMASVIDTCLSKNATERPEAAEVAQRLMPGAGALIEWPPPGLEALHGKLAQLTKAMAVGSALFAFSALGMITYGPRMSSVLTSGGTLILTVLVAVGLMTLVAAGYQVARVGLVLQRAARYGFGWLTLAEVMADHRGDTGTLTAGAREYASVIPATRNVLRKRRVVAGVTLLAAAAIPVPALVILIALGSRDLVGPSFGALFVVGPSLALLAVGLLALRTEWDSLREVRQSFHKERHVVGDDEAVVQAWYESFEAGRRGQTLGRGPSDRPMVRWTAMTVFALGLTVSVLVATPFVVVGFIGPAIWQIMIPKFSNTEARARIAEVARVYALPHDSSITPLAAGQALLTLSTAGAVYTPDAYGRPPARQLDNPFLPGGSNPISGGSYVPRPWVLDTIMMRAVDGFNPEETEFLEQIAAHPGFVEFALMARAPAYDWIDARLALPLPDDYMAVQVPLPKYFPIRDAAYARVLTAALELSKGREREAELALREVVSFGFQMLDNAPFLMGSLIGMVTAGIGRSALEDFFVATGRESEARSLKASYDSVLNILEEIEVAEAQTGAAEGVPSMTELQRNMLTIVQDSTRLRGLRWELLGVLGFAPCTNLQELIFGSRRDIEEALERARSDLARLPGEKAFFELRVEQPSRWGRVAPDGSLEKAVYYTARAVGWLLGNDRLAGCLNTFLLGV